MNGFKPAFAGFSFFLLGGEWQEVSWVILSLREERNLTSFQKSTSEKDAALRNVSCNKKMRCKEIY